MIAVTITSSLRSLEGTAGGNKWGWRRTDEQVGLPVFVDLALEVFVVGHHLNERHVFLSHADGLNVSSNTTRGSGRSRDGWKIIRFSEIS